MALTECSSFQERCFNQAITDQIQNIESNHHHLKKEKEPQKFKESLPGGIQTSLPTKPMSMWRACYKRSHSNPSSAPWRLERIPQRGNRVVAAVSPLFRSPNQVKESGPKKGLIGKLSHLPIPGRGFELDHLVAPSGLSIHARDGRFRDRRSHIKECFNSLGYKTKKFWRKKESRDRKEIFMPHTGNSARLSR